MITLEGLNKLWTMLQSPDPGMQELGIQSTMKYLNITVAPPLGRETLKGICGHEIARESYKLGISSAQELKKYYESTKSQTQTSEGFLQEDPGND